MGINCMSLAVWLEDRKYSAAVVGLDEHRHTIDVAAKRTLSTDSATDETHTNRTQEQVTFRYACHTLLTLISIHDGAQLA